ncbi:MAG: DinB family protein [Lewinellaceae bacterium]|nr:DinB family protein [Saprospiraceae bacterium]MCB9317316.1 DinB family protein [Lewinellaceae bacterium]MCB9331744.1 DinB family protein [Lewinellaceae bacterium]
MEQPGILLHRIIDQATPELLKISPEIAATPPQPGKWSPAEIIGHLIDSASNNHGRFLRAQQSAGLTGLPYDQEFWVEQQQYRSANWPELVQLWAAFNRQLARGMDTTPEESLTRLRLHHNLDQIAFKTVPADKPVTLLYFMQDYVAHLEHHLMQILPGHERLLLEY